VNVRAISGDVGVAVRRGLGVLLDASSTSGDVHSTLEPGERTPSDAQPDLELTVTTVSGDVEIRRASASS
jgi:predicted membrane protein